MSKQGTYSISALVIRTPAHAVRKLSSSSPKYAIEKNAPRDVLVFVTKKGRPAGGSEVRYWVRSTTFRYTGVAVNPHMLRHIWATTYIKRTRDFVGAAKRLGDTVATTMAHYAHLLDDEAEAQGDAFNNQIFGITPEEPPATSR